MAKSGYAGQLYEVTILAITGTPGPSVAEGGTLQLSAMAVLDDATQLAPAPGSVVWNVATGPLTGIDAAGLASAGQLGRTTRPARRPLGAGSPVNSR